MEWIAAANVGAETWRRLLEFANIEIAEEAISFRHGEAPDKRRRQQYRKQASQLRVALLQAHEYFDAAEKTSLITSPNHVYYGLLSLASAVMLLLGTGEHSYDALRANTRSRHHGLVFTVGPSARAAGQGTELLRASHVEIIDRGHFPTWHSLLPRQLVAIGLVRRHHHHSQDIMMAPLGADILADTRAIIGRKVTIIDALRHLPDLASDLGRYGIDVIHTLGGHELAIRPGGERIHTWILRNAGSNRRLLDLLERFCFRSPAIDAITVSPNIELSDTSGCVVRFTESPAANAFSWPSGRLTCDGELVMYAEDVDTHEFVDLYIAAFGLSMLSRYFPDLWIVCLDAHCKSAKIIEAFTALARRKAPILALELLLGRRLRISTHRSPTLV
jgi:hypothetical protein